MGDFLVLNEPICLRLSASKIAACASKFCETTTYFPSGDTRTRLSWFLPGAPSIVSVAPQREVLRIEHVQRVALMGAHIKRGALGRNGDPLGAAGNFDLADGHQPVGVDHGHETVGLERGEQLARGLAEREPMRAAVELDALDAIGVRIDGEQKIAKLAGDPDGGAA